MRGSPTSPDAVGVMITLVVIAITLTVGFTVSDQISEEQLEAEFEQTEGPPEPQPLSLESVLWVGLGGLAIWFLINHPGVVTVPAGIIAGAVAARYIASPTTFGVLKTVTSDTDESVTCVHCDRDDDSGVIRRYGKHLAAFGVSLWTIDGGRVPVCSTCHEDPVQGQLEAIRDNPEATV